MQADCQGDVPPEYVALGECLAQASLAGHQSSRCRSTLPVSQHAESHKNRKRSSDSDAGHKVCDGSTPTHGFCQVVVRVQIATGQRFCGSAAFGLPPVGSFAVLLKWYYHHARISKAPVGEFSTRTMVSALMS